MNARARTRRRTYCFSDAFNLVTGAAAAAAAAAAVAATSRIPNGGHQPWRRSGKTKEVAKLEVGGGGDGGGDDGGPRASELAPKFATMARRGATPNTGA